jgi:3-deoxy-D-manno-octulosonic acid (KDO) 8-phosphate synthase
VFVEVHPDPGNARSDATTQLPPERAERLIASLVAVRRALAGILAPRPEEPAVGP